MLLQVNLEVLLLDFQFTLSSWEVATVLDSVVQILVVSNNNSRITS